MKSTLLLGLLFTLLFCLPSRADDTTTLPQRATGETITATFFNSLTNALNGTLVPRHGTTGIPTSGQNLGTATYPWGDFRATTMTITGTSTLASGSISSSAWDTGSSTFTSNGVAFTAKAPLASPTFTGTITFPTNTVMSSLGRLTVGEVIVVNGESLNLNASGAAANNEIGSWNTADSLTVYGGSNTTSGAVIFLGGSAHASASTMQLKTANVVRASVSAAGLVTIGSASDTTTIHAFNGATVAAGVAASTLLTSPAGAAGDPDIWLELNWNGTDYIFPAWTP